MKSLGVLCDSQPRVRVPGEKGQRGLPRAPPECRAGRRSAAQTLLTPPTAHLCPLCPVLPAELTSLLLLPLLWHQLPLHWHLHPGGQGRGWLS